MAVDERKFSDTLRLGSEDGFEISCSPCARDDKNLPAIKYCVECDENFCSSCLTHHNKFPMMRVHQITDNLSSRTGQRPQLPTERCDRHGGKLIDVYCPIDDVVGCSTCINVEHASCCGIQYIPDMTQDLQLSKEILDLETTLQHLLARLDHLKQQKQDQLKLLQQEKDQLLNDIEAQRKRINEKLDEMEKTDINEVDAKIEARARDVSKDIDVISNSKIMLEKRQTSIENSKNNNNAELFIQLKMGVTDVQIALERNLFKIQTDALTMKVKLLPEKNVQRLLETNVISLGSISEILIAELITHDRNVNIRLSSDRKSCWITDICLTSGGDIYLADEDNSRIKKLGFFYTVEEYLDLPSLPGTLCEVDETRLAVTLVKKKKVQFVYRNPLTLRGSFTVGDCCRGIDYYNGQLYVCCGGNKEKGARAGRIEVYSVEGALLRSYYQGATLPNYVHVSKGGNLIISNVDKISLVNLRMTDHSVSDMQIKALRHPTGMCRVGESQLCVAGKLSNNIILISEDGAHQQELLTERDGISNPWAVCFIKQQSRLIVSFLISDTIKIFKITNA